MCTFFRYEKRNKSLCGEVFQPCRDAWLMRSLGKTEGNTLDPYLLFLICNLFMPMQPSAFTHRLMKFTSVGSVLPSVHCQGTDVLVRSVLNRGIIMYCVSAILCCLLRLGHSVCLKVQKHPLLSLEVFLQLVCLPGVKRRQGWMLMTSSATSLVVQRVRGNPSAVIHNSVSTLLVRCKAARITELSIHTFPS